MSSDPFGILMGDPLEDKHIHTWIHTRLSGVVNGVGSDPEKKFLLKSIDWIDTSPGIDSGSLFPADERFLELLHFPIPIGKDAGKNLLDTSIN
ncbi:hypothetical protein D5086_003914 [Populus alba]|uniref:Uncharacterized protein n=1 Tax=Populus alba TaxID=43335 RepID=A0ACC4D7J4_POPAL